MKKREFVLTIISIILFFIQIIFFILKIMNLIDWNWIIVLIPVIIFTLGIWLPWGIITVLGLNDPRRFY